MKKPKYPNENQDLFQIGIKALFRNSQGQILVLESNTKYQTILGPHWDLPGGRIKDSHSIEETLKREIEEEIGVKDFQILDLFDVSIVDRVVPAQMKLVRLALVTYLCSGDCSQITLSHEHQSSDWVNPQKAAELLVPKYPKDFAQKIAKL